MNIIKKSILLFISLFLISCASGVQNLRKIEPGMTSSEVESLMGRRDGFSSAQHEGDTYVLHKYINRLCNAHVSIYDKCDFYIIYRNGFVIETGVSNVRSTPPNMAFLYLFKLN